MLSQLFEAQFDPALKAPKREAELDAPAGRDRPAARRGDAASTKIASCAASSARSVRRCARTTIQKDGKEPYKSWLSFKLDPRNVPELPQPRPAFEIFVYSPRVEGVHLRMGHVARGGIRWSDRREDFRTEVLGLMKAQNVKNTVIVPVGAKGGFVPKRLPANASREDVQREGVECYRTFIRGLLDITDNIVDGKVVPPPQVVRRDDDDPYLVVAADKGTATFSDIANRISAEYNFWLGDAFASGGSAGYDHKKMGITARGGWECVKRHFRELGVDTQSQDFTAVGIGDMAGDVFGNGMLQSPHTKLLAAFNHQHIFLDPTPDPAASFAERQRMFALPRSSWEDYDRKVISKGGGVFPRSAKSIKLSPQVQAMFGVKRESATPLELIKLILCMQVDLLWNGGIGTYVKASDESHGDVGDRANDAVRVNGKDLRCRVVGEGGNLGLSQRGRVEYATQRRQAQHRLRRQLRRRRLLGPRSQHQDPAQQPAEARRAHAREAQPGAGRHDGRRRVAGAARQLPAEPGAVDARDARRERPARARAFDPLAGAGRLARSRARIPARRGRDHRASQGRPRPDAPRARDPARLLQDGAVLAAHRLGRAGGSVPRRTKWSATSRASCSSASAAICTSIGCVARSSRRRRPTAW